MRIMIVDAGSALYEEFHKRERGAFTNVRDVLFVRQPDDQNSGGPQRDSLGSVKLMIEARHDMARHGDIDFAGEFDETRRLSILALSSSDKRGRLEYSDRQAPVRDRTA